MAKNPNVVSNLAQLAKAEGVARSTATRWDAAGHVVRLPDGQIDVAATRRIVREERDPRSAAARRRILEARASREEIRLARESGEVADLRLVGATWERATGVFRQRMLAIPRMAVSRLQGVSGNAMKEKVIRELIHDALHELATKDYDPIVGEEEEKLGLTGTAPGGNAAGEDKEVL